jgi:hypothetical protein
MKAMHLVTYRLNDADPFISGYEGEWGAMRISPADRQPVGGVDGARQHADHDAGWLRLGKCNGLDGQNILGRPETVSNDAQHERCLG